LEEVDLSRFWTEFEASAPLHLRLGLRAAGVSLGALLPRLLGYRRGLAELDAEAREAVIVRASQLPGFSDLVEVAKVVACLAYFNDPAVQAAGRSRA
jgi:hypothetical protein